MNSSKLSFALIALILFVTLLADSSIIYLIVNDRLDILCNSTPHR